MLGQQRFDWFVGGIGNARWAGTPLAPILEEAGIQKEGREVVFFGADSVHTTSFPGGELRRQLR